MTTNNAEQATSHVASVKAAEAILAELYAQAPSDARSAQLAQVHHLQRVGLKLAQVHAQLASADAVDQLRDAVRTILDGGLAAAQAVPADVADLMRREYLGSIGKPR